MDSGPSLLAFDRCLYFQRFAMLEGFFSIVASFCHQDFLTMATKTGGGWLDVLFNRDSRGRTARPRPTDLIMPPVVHSAVPLHLGPWHLTWSPPAVRLWARLPPNVDAEVLRFATVVQDWYGPSTNLWQLLPLRTTPVVASNSYS